MTIDADERADVATLLRDAAKLVTGKETACTVYSCLGDLAITVDDEHVPEVPHAKGDRVRCLDRTSAYKDMLGTVQHSGPRYTGVLWDGETQVNVRPNVQVAAQPEGDDRP